ncbi:MAG: UDP-N-acetylglucosamine 2-epimerase [Sarcina sp.]
MRKIAVVTATRAEYGVLKNIIKAIDKEKYLQLELIVTGTHLSKELGMTINEIKEDRIEIKESFPIIMDYDKEDKNGREFSLAVSGFVDAFSRLKPEILLVLGDRYEILAAATVATVMGIPIAHISGGEITEGAMDDKIRHSITKLANIHFPGAKEYGENIIAMGEEPFRIFNFGAAAIENIKNTEFLSDDKLSGKLGFSIEEKFFLITYHSVTLEEGLAVCQIKELIKALKEFSKDYHLVITYPNSDNGGREIIEELKKFNDNEKKVHLFKSLGSIAYLSAMKKSSVVIGNSSSAIIEGSFLKIPVINVGNRQKGRLKAENIIDVSNESSNIVEGIKKAISEEFLEKTEKSNSLYGEGETSKEIVRVLKEIRIDEKLIKKKFYKREK